MCDLPVPPHGKFYDLNIPFDENVASLSKRLSMLVELGYGVVALDKFVPTTDSNPSKGKKTFNVPQPPAPIVLDEASQAQLKADQATFTQLKRITVELGGMGDLHKVRDILASGKYDLVAVLPRTDKLFHASCTTLNIDIICIDGSDRLPYIPKHNVVRSAASRGIYFEICYSPMIRDTTVRRLTITNVLRFAESSQGKNHILSSGARTAMELRGPHDVANLNSLFCVKRNIFLHTVSKHCRAAVVHGFSRQTAKCAVFIQKDSKTVSAAAEGADEAQSGGADDTNLLALSAGSKEDIADYKPSAKRKRTAK